MDNIIRFPSQIPMPPAFGPVATKVMNVRCEDCGNEERFYGKAMTNPFLIIEKVKDQRYDVTEIGYRNNGSVDEIIESCAVCGSKNLDIEVLKKDVK